MSANREYKSDVYISFYEHQSTYNPNMPLRNIIYLANWLEDWLKKNNKDLYSRKLIKIPTPHFVVFYNGVEERPENEEMRLSWAFQQETDAPELEVICKVININPNNNQGLKQRSTVLQGYCYFVDSVRAYQELGRTLEEAVDNAIEDCIREQILELDYSEEDYQRARQLMDKDKVLS